MSVAKGPESSPSRLASGLLPQCHTCRKRRVRCDSTRPACHKCIAKGVQCLGYGRQKPLVWLHGGGNQNQYLVGGTQSVPKRRKKGRPKIIIAKEDVEEPKKSPEGVKINTSEVSDLVQAASDIPRYLDKFDPLRAPETLDFNYPLDIKVVVSTIWYFNKYIYPEVDPIVYYQDLPTIDPKSWQDDISNMLFQILVSVVATHRAVKSQTDEKVSLGHEIYQYKQQAFRRLSFELGNPATQLGDLTLVCVLTLLLAETQQSAYGEWLAHFEGATKIIELKGGVKFTLDRCPQIKSSLTCYLLADVLGATTSRNVLSMSDASRQLGYSKDLPHIFCNGSESFVPCPNELFDYIIRINYFRALSAHAVGTNNMMIDFANIQMLLQNILSFSAPNWADGMVQHYANTAVIPHRKTTGDFIIRPDRDIWLQIATIYQAAILLYCIRSLALDFQGLILASYSSDTAADMISYVTVQDIQIVARQTLSDHLGKIFAPGSDLLRQSLARVVTWPLFIAGVEAGDHFEDATALRKLVLSAFGRLSRALGTLHFRDARAFLENEYRRRDSISIAGNPDYRCWWDDVFEQLPDRCAFFV
ncbi:hypothetical protein ACO22_00820 [Paracoccidioides brasiliensis]|uniref:Uncharacterized protein n=1 Tax=Paracoccidioides brasiliensis TaxID=121759 RepID=A0A1D2JNB0_PARBR|nr:hypothetical protein ACO22_00820 [Paracoccidioides brasiliensis]ODH50873.1 hypothetical protein GX48_03015 [Paracoccidioides brasiliensis]